MVDRPEEEEVQNHLENFSVAQYHSHMNDIFSS